MHNNSAVQTLLSVFVTLLIIGSTYSENRTPFPEGDQGRDTNFIFAFLSHWATTHWNPTTKRDSNTASVVLK